MPRGPLISDEPFAERRRRPRSEEAPTWSPVRRDAWRAELLQAQVAEENKRRQDAEHMRQAIVAGVAIGVIGSIASFFM